MIGPKQISDSPDSIDSPGAFFGPHPGPAPIRNSGKRHLAVLHTHVNIGRFDLVIASQSFENRFTEMIIRQSLWHYRRW